MRPPVELPEGLSGYSAFFDFTNEPEIAAEVLGYTFGKAEIGLPRTTDDLSWTVELRERLRRILPRVSLTSETARRELLVSPIFIELMQRYDIQLRLEYPLNLNKTLRGSLDYFVQSGEDFLIVAAKNDDMARGSSQLVAELAALDEWTVSESPTIYGAVSIGTVWQFIALHRQERRVEQDTTIYRIPNEVTDICAILLGILHPERDLPR